METVSHLVLFWLVPASCTTGAQTANMLLAGALPVRYGLSSSSLLHLVLWCILAFCLTVHTVALGEVNAGVKFGSWWHVFFRVSSRHSSPTADSWS
ncbi:uncharacterized protein BO88DRAFT_404409 [Aspergillus vadensis CBS 113365]|uniref:Amino acid permease/ SLC12A domain-containing protein n=1 Tax=Aspergillus vadensis (strain CBS 113365 / IMI 142717 / IBT 24658) TaxID=1448311 RepID=A0A319BAQ9_ASPVC|nr:hypothetical protein BO88DRAFT_404409 [Aspergillus vadensis CBS 113365]PYH70066.1 hypothetical protein BO88DRAFT_404409 [Aspergillus vadensis CBS 113365]